MKTMLCMILDRSGSMGGRERDVVGGVNRFIADQKEVKGCERDVISMMRFDSVVERFRSMKPLALCPMLLDQEYQPRGSTALLDAIGHTLKQLDEDWSVERPDRCICVIVTDGEENASVEFNRDQVKRMIQSRERSGRWSFIYLGANVDAFAEAQKMGISAINTVQYDSRTSRGIEQVYASASAAVGTMRATGSTQAHNLGVDLTKGQVGQAGPLFKPQVPGVDLTQMPKQAMQWTPPEEKPGEQWVPPEPSTWTLPSASA